MRRAMGRHRRPGALIAALGILAGAAGCGGKTGAAPDDAGAGIDTGDDLGEGEFDAVPDWAPPVCPAAGGEIQNAACNAELAAGPCVVQVQVDDSAPGPAGGTLTPGTYDLVERIIYTSPGGATGPIGEPRQETLVIGGGGTDFTISSAVLSAATTTRQNATATVASAQFKLTVTATCPPVDGGAGTASYFTAREGSLTLYRLGPTGPVQADRYTLR